MCLRACRYTLGFHYKGIPYLEPGFATIQPLTEKMQAQHAQLLADAQQQQQQSASTGSSTSQQKESRGPQQTVNQRSSAKASKAQQPSASTGNSSDQAGSDPAPSGAKLSAVSQVVQMVATILNVLVSKGEEPLTGPKGEYLLSSVRSDGSFAILKAFHQSLSRG